MRTWIQIEFAEHIPIERIQNLMTFAAACGNVKPGKSDRHFEVEILRQAKLDSMRKTLQGWDNRGVAKWLEVNDEL
jgi:hypothetical protein